jgi:hypothetical protein
MNEPTQALLDQARREAAATERAAILDLIERHLRQLSHGHGANGVQVLQHLADEVQRRGSEESR